MTSVPPDNNPYRAPTAAVRDAPPPPRSPIVAVLVGLVVDIGGSMLASIVIGIVYAVVLATRGMPPAEVGRTLTALDPSSGYFIFSSMTGFGFSLLGGYVCARIARRDERRLSVILAALIEVIGLVLGAATLGIALNVLMLVVTFAVVIAGGELGRRRNLADARKLGAVTAA